MVLTFRGQILEVAISVSGSLALVRPPVDEKLISEIKQDIRDFHVA